MSDRRASATLPRSIEHASLRAWPPLEAAALDGWELRFSRGFSKRANSVQAFSPSTRALSEKVEHCEAWYSARALPSIFRLTPFADPDLDSFLERRGYEVVDPTAVLHRAVPPIMASDTASELRSTPLEGWLFTYSALSQIPEGPPPALRSILEGCHQERFLGVLSLPQLADPVSCGMAVVDGALVGLFDLVTAVSDRRKGYGTSLIAGLLGWGVTRGASRAYLQVVRSNAPAFALYEKLGFELAYDYWYRVRVG